jgi:hypothetical protein
MDNETKRREAIHRVAQKLQNESSRAGKPISHQQAAERVRQATVLGERKKNR